MKTDSPASIIQEILTTSPPAFSDSEINGIAADLYGIHASVQLLVSERDQNFKLDTGDGKSFTLKISNHAEKLDVIDFQNQALVRDLFQPFVLPLFFPNPLAHLFQFPALDYVSCIGKCLCKDPADTVIQPPVFILLHIELLIEMECP